jgi:tetratricopeptide (TPR) repeat protein
VAARLRSFDIDDLVAQLSAVLDLASDGPRDQPARQRTLRDTVRWSIGLLTPHERQVVLALSVFRGGWTAAAAGAVADDDDDDDDDPDRIGTTLTSLADKSLVTQLDSGRYDMLETIRAFAGELLGAQPDALDRARRAHRHHMVGSARAWLDTIGLDERLFEDIVPYDAAALADLDNLRAALHFDGAGSDVQTAPLAMWTALLVRSFDLAEALAHIEAGLARVTDDAWRFWLGMSRLSVLWGLGRWADVESDAIRLMAMAEHVRPQGRASLLNFMGIAQWRLGRNTEADATLQRALALPGTEPGWMSFLLLHNRGLVAETVGDLRAATSWYEQASIAASGDTTSTHIADLRLAGVALERGMTDEVVDRLRASIRATSASQVTRAMAAAALVDALLDRGDLAAATEFAERLWLEVADWEPTARIEVGVALAHARLAVGDAAGAEAAASEADGLATRMSEVDHRRLALHVLGLARRQLGDLAGARRALEQVLTGMGGDSASATATRLHCDLAVVERAAGDAAGAWRRQRDALVRALATGATPAAGDACCYLADAAAGHGDLELAATLLGAADAIRSKAGVEKGRLRARGVEAVAALDRADPTALTAHRDAGRSLPIQTVLTLVRHPPLSDEG